MAYNKTVWTDRESEFPNRYKDQNDNALSLTRDEGVVSSTGTFINAAVMNNIENAVEAVSKYITATAGSNGDFHINLGSSFTLTEGLTIKVKFPAATNSASNARFSIDNGTTYTNCRMGAVNLTADELQSQVVTMVYDGTYWGFEGSISGSNANGEWQKFSDGSMYCIRKITGLDSPSVDLRDYLTPKSFASSNYITQTTASDTSSVLALLNRKIICIITPDGIRNPTNTTFPRIIVNSVGETNVGEVNISAQGRWY